MWLCIVILMMAGYSVQVTSVFQQPRIVCFYESWAQFYKKPMAYHSNQIPGYLCKDIVYAYAGLDENTMRVKVLDYYADITNEGFQRVVSLKNKFKHLKVMISIGGWSDGGEKYSKMVSTLKNRSIFVQSVLDFVAEHGFNGMNLYWCFPGENTRGGTKEDKQNMVLLAQELRTAFRRNKLKLTVTIPANPLMLFNGYDIKQLERYVDEFYVATYNNRGHWLGFADVHSPFYGHIHDSIDYKEQNINRTMYYINREMASKNKIVFGLPFYGNTYTLDDSNQNMIGSKTTGFGDEGVFTTSFGILSYYEICGKFMQDEWIERWDETGIAPYAFCRNQWIGYEDPRSLKMKIRKLRENEFNSIMVWAVNLDDYYGICGSGRFPLLTAVFESLSENLVQNWPPVNNSYWQLGNFRHFIDP